MKRPVLALPTVRSLARNRTSRVAPFLVAVVAAGALSGVTANAARADAAERAEIPSLHAPASVVRDVDGVPHIKASNEHDLFFLQGWVHADDRLFQMDVTRRRVSGTVAELVGRSALSSDVQMRTLGLGVPRSAASPCSRGRPCRRCARTPTA